VVCQPRQDAGNNSRCADRFGDLQGAVEGGEAFLQTALTMEQVEGAVVQPGPGVIGRRRGLLEQPQRLLDQRQPDGAPLDRPDVRGALADDRDGGAVGVIAEPALGLLGHRAGAHVVAG
jgi:hypothetical protein